MTIPPLAKRVFPLFSDAGHEIYLVGGTVRDLLRGQPHDTDLDFAVSTPPEETQRLLRGAGYKTYAPGKRFGTISAVVDDDTLELTTFRCHEQYEADSRHPDVTYGGSIEQDLERRDFTMNAIALAADGTLVDPYHGAEDITQGRIVVPGDIEQAFRDDPLRLLRLARFISQLGFHPTQKLARRAKDLAFLITGVSRERWKRELEKMLCGAAVAEGLEFCMRTGLITFMMPELTPMQDADQTSAHHSKDVWEHTKEAIGQSLPIANVRWALLFHDCGKPYTKSVENGDVHFFHHEAVSAMLSKSVMNRLRFSKDQRTSVSKLVANHMRPNSYDPNEWNDAAVRRLYRDMGSDWDDMLAMSRADITSRRANVRKRGVAKLEHLSGRVAEITEVERRAHILPKYLGNAIIEAFDAPEGPAIGKAMQFLRETVDAGALEGEREVPYYIEALREQYPPFAGAKETTT